jgi:chorismate-pyruvate lyase
MSNPATPDLDSLAALFPPASSYLTAYEYVPAEAVPQPYQNLLVHEHHMTVTVEAFHRSLVDVRVLDKRRDGDSYARKILLPLQSDGRIVLFGLVRIWLNYCSAEVRDEILSETTPLGRVLINHNVLRRIEPTAYLRVVPGPEMLAWFDMAAPAPVYGRLAIIHCDDQPAVELLEIVPPEPAA